MIWSRCVCGSGLWCVCFDDLVKVCLCVGSGGVLWCVFFGVYVMYRQCVYDTPAVHISHLLCITSAWLISHLLDTTSKPCCVHTTHHILYTPHTQLRSPTPGFLDALATVALDQLTTTMTAPAFARLLGALAYRQYNPLGGALLDTWGSLIAGAG